MKVYLCTYHHNERGTSGADVYHYYLAELLCSWGWEVKSLSQRARERYQVGNVTVCGMADHIHNELWADIIITIPMMHTMCRKGKPLFVIKHNIGTEPYRFDDCRILYCGEAVRQHLQLPCIDSFVWNPHNRFAGQPHLHGRKYGYWLLINCNAENKGGRELIELAKKMPHKSFVGVIGAYGNQVTGSLPNLRYIDTTHDLADVYAGAAGILSFSKFEGFPTVLLEAMSHNLPVVAFPIPGVIDACQEYGTYCRTIDEMVDVINADEFSDTRERADGVQFNRDFEGLKKFLTI